MAKHFQEFNPQQEESINQGEQLQRLLYRVLPFWPLIVMAIALGMLCAKIYLRYQVPIYVAKARVVVNDESEQKSANLQEIIKLDTRNLNTETEREIMVLSSKDLLGKVASKLQLNIQYIQQGRVRIAQYYDENVPFKLEFENPDSVKSSISGEAEWVGDKVIFKGESFPIDSTVPSVFGNIRWSRNTKLGVATNIKKLQINIVPVAASAGQMKGSLTVNPISKQSSILDLTYLDAIPDRAVEILTTLISIYGSSSVDYKTRMYDNAQKFLEERLRLISDELNGVESSLEKYKQAEGGIDPGREAEIYTFQKNENYRKIGELTVQKEVLKQIDQYVKNRNNASNPIPATLGISDPVLINLLNQLYEAEANLEKTKATSGTKSPQLELYEEAIKKLKPSIIVSLNNLNISVDAGLRRLQDDYDKMVAALGQIPHKARQELDITRQQGIKNAIYTFLLQKKEETAIAAALVVPNYRVIEKAEKGGVVSPDPKKTYTIAILISLIVILVYIYLREFSSKKILFRSQLENALPLPVISELIYYDHDPISPIVVGAGKRTLIAEQFRELRTNINYITAATKDKCKVILTTSSIPKEGKSFIAINAAISLSLTGDRVVLLEFDLRKPKISKPLGIARDPGLSNYLIGKSTVEEVIKAHASIENLYVIPSGPVPPNPAELLSGPKLLELFTYLKQHFDYVIIDSPPVAAVTDAKILAAMADATIYIIRHNYTNQVFLNLINDINNKKGLPNINIVFNGIINKKVLGYGYGKGYGYGYGYGYSYGYGYGYTTEEKRQRPSPFSFLSKLFSNPFRKKRSDDN